MKAKTCIFMAIFVVLSMVTSVIAHEGISWTIVEQERIDKNNDWYDVKPIQKVDPVSSGVNSIINAKKIVEQSGKVIINTPNYNPLTDGIVGCQKIAWVESRDAFLRHIDREMKTYIR